MNFKRKIKKELKKLPVKSFNEFLTEHPGLEIYFEKKPIGKKRKTFSKWILAPVSFVLVAAILVPIALYNLLGGNDGGGETPAGEQPPINGIAEYGENDIESIPVTQEFFSDKTEVLLLDLEKIMNDPKIIKEVPIENSDIDVGYIIKDAFVPFLYNNRPCAFYITYRIRVYEHYSFSEEKKFESLSSQITIGDYEMEYTLSNLATGNECNVYFNFNDNDYYIYVKEAMPHWELTDAALQALLVYLFN